MKKGSEKRIKILEDSLSLELMASTSLAFLLDIEYSNIKESKSLGNTSSSLSFNQKVNLLLDNKSITKEDKLKLESFMNIRNQLIHNAYADSYVKTVQMTIGLQKRLETFYPNNFENIELELALEKCVNDLVSDAMCILVDFKGGKENKLRMNVERNVYFKYYNNLKNVMKSEFDELVNFIKEEGSQTISKEDLIKMLKILHIQIVTNSLFKNDEGNIKNE